MDNLRTDLIIRFYCRECGNKLNVSYGQTSGSVSSPEEGDPVGAKCRYSPISVWPCESCIEKHTAPAKALAAAIDSLMDTPVARKTLKRKKGHALNNEDDTFDV